MVRQRRVFRSLFAAAAAAAWLGLAVGCGGSSSTGADDPEDLSGRWLYHQVVTESTFPSTLVGDEGAMYITVEVAGNTITLNLADFPVLSGPFDPATGTFTASGSGRGGWNDSMTGQVVNQKKMVGKMTMRFGSDHTKVDWDMTR